MTRRPTPLALIVLAAGLAGPALAQSGGQAARPSAQPASSLPALRERAIDMLIEMSSHSLPQVRANAIEGLEPAPSRLEPIISMAVLDSNVGVRTVALMVAGRHGLDSIEPIARTCATESSPYVQAAALFALHKFDDQTDLTPIGALLMDHEDPRVRAHAAFVLGEIGQDSALPMLRQAAARPMPRASEASILLLRLQIAEAMVKLGDDEQIHTLHAALFPSRPEDLEAAALAAQILGEVDARRSIPDLINLALEKDEQGNPMPAEIRLAAARSVAKLGRRDGDFIADEFASSDNPVLRAQVASVYAETLERDELATLEAMLDDPDPLVQVAAASGLLRAVTRISGR